MFPNNSSSYDISSKTNAFVQIYEEEGDGNVREMAQSHLSICPALQVPETRDVMVVVNGERECGDPNLTVIANHPSPPAPAKIPSAQKCERGSDGSSKMPRAERQNTGALCLVSIKSLSSSNNNNINNNNNNDTTSDKESNNNIIQSQSSTLSNIPQTNDDGDDNESFKICDYYSRWGIPRCLKLIGGGESSLTTGTSGWGSPPTGASGTTTGGWNTGSTAAATGGGGGGGGGGSAQPQQQQGQSQQQQSQSQQQWAGQQSSVSRQPNNSQQAPPQQQGGPTSQSQASSTPTSQSQGQGNTNSSNSNNGSTSTISSNSNSNTQQGSQPGGGQSGGGQAGQSQQSGGAQGQGASAGGGGAAGSAQGSSSWAAAAGKGLSSGSSVQGGGLPSSSNNSGTSTKQQMEQLNTMREALYSQDGWGGQNVNQDSNWDIPGSPEPGVKDNGSSAPVPMWKPTINNGTDLWEANLRNGGLPPPQSQPPKTAWGHTPSTNLGGMWGEDDDGDASNVWTGVPPAATASAPQWTNQPAPIWPGGGGGSKKEGEWGGPTNWGDQRDPRDLRSHDIRQMIDPRDHMRATSMDHRGMGGNEVLMQRDSRGSGRLNNGATTEAMWAAGAPGPHHHMPHHQNKLPSQPNQPGVNQWPGGGGGGGGGGGPPMKEMGGLGGKPTGWEEPSPPAQRRNMPNYDDGTSLWGPQHSRPAMPGQNKVSHWKEMPAPAGMRSVLQCPPAGRVNPNMKPEQPLWAHPQRNGGWADGMDVGGPWVEDKPAPWMDQPLTPSSWQSAPKHKCWDADLDPSSSWVHPSKQVSFLQPPKPITKDIIWGSKQFRMLTEMGFKKDDVETALRSANMNLEDALEFLNATRPLSDCWSQQQQRRHADLDPDHTIVNPYPSPQPICIQYPTQSSRTQQTQQPSTQQLRMLVQQIQMAVQAGYLNQQILNQPLAPQTLLSLNQLLQHIKVLQQLMQQHAMIQVQNPMGKPNSNNQLLQLSVQITKTKQSITNLQNQIAAQQAVYVKQQQQQIAAASQNDFFKSNVHDPLTTFHPNIADLSIKEHQGGGTSQQSRLNQWKLPAVDKDSDLSSGNEFSRAPGTTTKPTPGNSSPNINPLLGQPDRTWSSVNRNDCETGWPDSGGDDNSSKDWPSSSQPPSQAFSDLVPEFEPGKPWKGNPLKTIEDDPSLTPGSVLRSPLSLPTIKDTVLNSGGSSGAGKASPTTSSPLDIMPITPLSLSSSTWSFNPPSTTSLSKLTGSGGGGGNKGSNVGGGSGGSGWGDTSGPGASDLWSSVPKARGPPPGLAAKPQQQPQPQQQQQQSAPPPANGWSSLSTRWPTNQTAAWGSTWLLLRNLTPQIDGSTLKTLCLQHGPLQSFHLYLSHGIALAKYATRDEANKAQGALNNCVLGNTTIFAESPSESDVHTLLQHLGHSGGATGGGGGQGGSGGGGQSGGWRAAKAEATWGGGGGGQGGSSGGAAAWPASSLWAAVDSADQHRTTPSSLNSFLPGDLLGGESM